MQELRDRTIEPDRVRFECTFRLWGTVRRPASMVTCLVFASTVAGVRKIVKARYPRSDGYDVKQLPEGRWARSA